MGLGALPRPGGWSLTDWKPDCLQMFVSIILSGYVSLELHNILGKRFLGVLGCLNLYVSTYVRARVAKTLLLPNVCVLAKLGTCGQGACHLESI